MILITIGLVLFILTLSLDLATDLKLWKSKKPINHRRGAALRLIGLIPAAVLLGWPYFALMLIAFIMICSYYWFLFDGLFNIFRRFKWFFVGTDDPDDAGTDNFLQGVKPWLHITGKSLLIIVSTLIYIYCYIDKH